MGRQQTQVNSSFLRITWNILFAIFYPIITLFSLIFTGIILLFSSISSLLSKISKSTYIEHKPEWKPFISVGKVSIESLFIDEIMFGPSYYKLKTVPKIEELEKAFFGDFKISCFGGFLLQQWNSTDISKLPDYQLIFVNGSTGKIKDLGQIKAFTWSAVAEEDVVKVLWTYKKESGEVVIRKEDVIDTF